MLHRNARHANYPVQSPYAWIKRVVLLIAVLSFGGLIWYATANRDSLESGTGVPPLVKAPQSPVKERAEDPGGMDIPNQDKEVFDLLEMADGPSEKDARALTEKIKQQEQAAVAAAQEVEEKTQAAAQKVEETVEEAAKEADSFTRKIVESRKAQEAEQAAKQETAPAPKPETTTKLGAWAVQLASYKSDKSAKAGIEIFLKKHGDLLNNYKPHIQTVDLDSGTYHRVMFRGMETKSASADLCDKLKERGQGCINKKVN